MAKKANEVKMVKCPEPGCEQKLPEDDLRGQIDHMNTMHPNSQVVADRLRSSE